MEGKEDDKKQRLIGGCWGKVKREDDGDRNKERKEKEVGPGTEKSERNDNGEKRTAERTKEKSVW